MNLSLLKSEESPEPSDNNMTIPKGWRLPQWMRELAESGDKTAKDIVRMWDSGNITDRKSAYLRTMKNTSEAKNPEDAKERFLRTKREGLKRLMADLSSNTPPPLR